MFHPRFTFENFISVATNKSAFEKCVEFATTNAPSSNPIFLYGPTAVGKTHLLHAIGNYVANSRQKPKIAMAQTETFCAEGMGLMVPLEMCTEKELYFILSKQRDNYSSTEPPIPREPIKLICQEPGIDFRRAEGCMIRLRALYSASGKYPSTTQWTYWLCSTRRPSLGQNRA